MAALSVKDVRLRIESAVDAATGTSKSRFAGELFGYDAQQLMHGAFCVDAPSTDVHPQEGRQAPSLGTLANTEIRVQVAHKFRADGQIADTDDALDFEHTIIKAVIGTTRTDLHIVFDGASRDLTNGDEFRILTLTFRAIHRLALQ